jgi:hypothetical protein
VAQQLCGGDISCASGLCGLEDADVIGRTGLPEVGGLRALNVRTCTVHSRTLASY